MDTAQATTHWEQNDKRYLWHPFTQQQDWEQDSLLIIERAEGNWLIDMDGNRYLDGVSSLWVNTHGHQRTEINRAIIEQLGNVAHSTFLGLSHPPGIELARRLIELAPGQLRRVFYSDTGAAAVEIALKMAYQYWKQCDSPRPKKQAFCSLPGAYHGDTVGAMSVGNIDLYHETYRGLLFRTIVPPSHEGSFPSLEQVHNVIAHHAEELAAVIVEPLVQGASGIRVFPSGYTRALWEMAQDHQVLFIADEVATGFGKTGTMFACEQEGIAPDLMAIGKGISGGYLPLAATLTTEEIYRAFLGNVEDGRTFYHGHTYTGNPLACAAAVANLDIFEKEQTLERVRTTITTLAHELQRFHDLPMVGDVRQCGIMVGIELVQEKANRTPFPVAEKMGVRVIREARRHGVVIRPLGDVVVLMPPLSISESELMTLLNVVYDAIATVGKEYYHAQS